jgi:1-acyl-sn-glycerol-3-phosphate acyltransferase
MVQKIMRWLNYGWRLFATGVSFVSFGLGGLVLWGLVFPVLSVLPANRLQRIRRGQRVVHYSFYVFIGLMHRIGIMTYEINGLEKLNRAGQLIIANHPTLVDVVFLISRIKQANCIVKDSLWRNPFMRGPILNAGYISNGDPEKMIADCVACLQSDGNLIIFPEGTRSVPNKPTHFQRGAAAIALQANTIVTLVTISCTPSTLTKAEPWYHIPEHRFHLTMNVGNDVDLTAFTQIEPKSIAVRRFTHFLENYFSQNTHYGN